jgi:hypothetical protein
MTISTASGSPIVTGAQEVRFTPDLATDRLVFRLWPNGPIERRVGASLAVLGAVTSAGRPLRSSMTNPTTLVVDPPRPLAAGDAISVSLHWRLRVPDPPRGLDRLARTGPELRLGSFFPILAWQPGVGWATDPPTPLLAEASTSPTADFDVSVRVPPGEQALATGREVSAGHWTAHAVRDFALAIDRFQEATAVGRAPAPVKVTVGVGPGVAVSPAAVAARAVAYLQQYNRRFGPYPWSTLVVPVTRDLGSSGIEYPNLVFEGPGVLRVLAHEIGHQWFYSLVGDDQARDPWLDEGLATYVQDTADHLQGFFGRLGIPPAAAGHLGAPMTYWQALPYVDYQAGVYLQGERAIGDLGRQSQVDCALRGYVAANAYRIATQPDLARALARVFPEAPARLRKLGAHLTG